MRDELWEWRREVDRRIAAIEEMMYTLAASLQRSFQDAADEMPTVETRRTYLASHVPPSSEMTL